MKKRQKTRIEINGVDVSRDVMHVNIRRDPGDVESVDLTMAVDQLHVDYEGTLIVRINTEE